MVIVGRAEEGTHFCGRAVSYMPRYGKDMSNLGNKFIRFLERDRDLVCKKFKRYFKRAIKDPNNKITIAVNELIEDAKVSDVVLGCFCSPKRCHCDTIADYINNVIQQQEI